MVKARQLCTVGDNQNICLLAFLFVCFDLAHEKPCKLWAKQWVQNKCWSFLASFAELQRGLTHNKKEDVQMVKARQLCRVGDKSKYLFACFFVCLFWSGKAMNTEWTLKLPCKLCRTVKGAHSQQKGGHANGKSTLAMHSGGNIQISYKKVKFWKLFTITFGGNK